TQKGRFLELDTPLGEDYFLIHKFEFDEGISRLFTIHAEVLVQEDKEKEKISFCKPEDVLGKPVSILLNQEEANTFRYFNGIVNRISQGNRTDRFSMYDLTIVPHAWLFTQRIQNRIFTDKKVPDILRDVFK